VIGPGIADVTLGEIDEVEKRRLAKGVAAVFADIGVPEPDIGIHFRHVTGRDVAGAGGEFPFRAQDAPW
jgi:phenylpyruvate tautomerase PptA (4-oxalocrotonate tautomerase family)